MQWYDGLFIFMLINTDLVITSTKEVFEDIFEDISLLDLVSGGVVAL